jgi:hypothetical protein
MIFTIAPKNDLDDQNLLLATVQASVLTLHLLNLLEGEMTERSGV